MMRIRIILLSLITAAGCHHCYAQQDKKVDSLLAILKSLPADTARVSSLTALSKRYLQLSNTPEAKKYVLEAVELSKKIAFKKGEAAAHQQAGMVYTREYKFDEALKSFREFLHAAEIIRDRKGISNAYITIANTHFQQGDYSEAIKNHLVAARIKEELKDNPGRIQCFNNIGLNYWNMGNYPEAYTHYRLALKVRQEIKDSLGMAHSYNVLGVVYDDEGNYPESLKNYLASLKLYEKLGAGFGIAACQNNIGELYRKQQNYEEALKRYAAALKVYEKNEDQGGIAMTYTNRGEIYMLQGKSEVALKELEQALVICEEQDDKYGIAAASGNIGTLHYKKALTTQDPGTKRDLLQKALRYGQKALTNFETISQKDGMAGCHITLGLIQTEQKEFSAAGKSLQDGLQLSKESGVKERIKESYDALARLDSARGNWEGAYMNRQSHLAYRDSLLNQENSGKLLQLQVQHEFGKKEDSMKNRQLLMDGQLRQQTLLADQRRQALLLNEKEMALLSTEKRVQLLELEKHKAELSVREMESEKDRNRFEVLSKAKELQALELSKQKTVKRYIIGGFILFALLFFLIYRNYRSRQQLKLQVMRNRIASDLHDDIGSTLSSISIFSQMAQQESGKTIPLLETIGENSRKMLDAMADIVWTINPENDQFEKIILRMKSFAYELLGARNIDFEFIADEDISNLKLSMNIRKNLYLIFKEATNNLVKYSGAQKAHFRIKGEKNNLTMQIADNGVGFDMLQSTNGNGLKNMKKRAEEIGAVFHLDSAKNKGTTIEIKLAV